jgi:hypothetical protein
MSRIVTSKPRYGGQRAVGMGVAAAMLRSVGFRPETDEPVSVVGIGIQVQTGVSDRRDIATK